MSLTKPNLSKEEFLVLIKNAGDNITKAMNGYVKKGRISQKECDKHLAEYLPKLKVVQDAFKDGWPSPDKTPVINFAIRGYYSKMAATPNNDWGIWDDASVLIGPGYFGTFRFNTDPAKSKFGKGMLLPGIFTYKQGPHPRSKPNYPAFRNANAREVLPGLRVGQTGIKEIVTANMHSGGELNTNSAACQTVLKSMWAEFQKAAYKLSDGNKKLLDHIITEQEYS